MDKKNMEYNFEMLLPRIISSLDMLDLAKTKDTLAQIKDHCLCVGTGGSRCASLFASKVLAKKNDIIAESKEPRDILYTDLKHYKNLLAVTYANKNHGINTAVNFASNQGLNCYRLTNDNNDCHNISYQGNIANEESFISISSTIIPMIVMLTYYLDCTKSEVFDIVKAVYFKNKENDYRLSRNLTNFEIMTGDNTYTAASNLESTIIEAGIGNAIVHEKYDYCHGRTTTAHSYGKRSLIYLINGEVISFDKYLLDKINDCPKPLYEDITILQSTEKDKIVGEFDLTLQSLLLCRTIAKNQNKDLSNVDYSPIVKKLYRYNGDL